VFAGLLRGNAVKHQSEGDLPRVAVEQLDHVIHALRLSGELARLSKEQVAAILHALRVVGHSGDLTEGSGLPRVAPEQLDHVVHALRLSGELARLGRNQVDAIVHALRVAGHLGHLRDVSSASYDDGYLVCCHNADFLKDPVFDEAYRLGEATNSFQGFDVRWRIHVLCWAATHGRRLEGDFVECGVNRGGFSRAVMHYIAFHALPARNFYLLDTYCGIPEQDRHLAPECYHHAYSECYEEVCETFRPFPNARVVRGRVPDTLPQVLSTKVCYLAIDMNCAEPEIAALEFFWDKLVRGAVVVLDDYAAGPWHLRQKHAFDRFARERGVEVLTLPTCQGLIIKP
jgi:O-methyltransferase